MAGGIWAGALPGLQTGPAPWSADTADLTPRLRAIGLPPLSPTEGAAVHIHQHLDLYVDGGKVPVPAGIGIDPAVRPAAHPRHQRGHPRRIAQPAHLHPGAVLRRVGGRFTRNCLGGYCAGGGKRLRVYGNRAAYRGDPTTLPLASHQELLVAFGTAARPPSPIPSAYRFPPGL